MFTNGICLPPLGARDDENKLCTGARLLERPRLSVKSHRLHLPINFQLAQTRMPLHSELMMTLLLPPPLGVGGAEQFGVLPDANV